MPKKQTKSSDGRSVTHKLKYPLTWGEETVSEITLHPPKGADIEHLGKDPTMKDILSIASKCSKVELAKLRELDAQDAVSIADIVNDFLGAGQETGSDS
jgi:hypothetical protein